MTEIEENELRELYYGERMTVHEVADELGVEAKEIGRAMNDFGMERHADRQEERPWRDEETLRELYVDENYSMSDVAEELGCTPMTVQHWLEKYDLKDEGINQPPNRENEGTYEWRDEEAMRRMFVEQEMTIPEMQREMDCAYSTVKRWLQKHGIVENEEELTKGDA